MGTMIARFIPYKLAPSVFPRETLPPDQYLRIADSARNLFKGTRATTKTYSLIGQVQDYSADPCLASHRRHSMVGAKLTCAARSCWCIFLEDTAYPRLPQPSCVLAEPMFMQCMLGKRPYRHIFTEAYAMLAVLAGLCLIPILRVFASL